MNLYADLATAKRQIGISSTVTTNDALLLSIIEAVSREIDDFCQRHFYVETATRYFDSYCSERLIVDDLLTVTTLKTDIAQDGTYDSETWVEGTDFYLLPYNVFPKTLIEATSFGTYHFATLRRSIQIVGSFGYGDGRRSDPVDSTGATVASITDSATSMTVSNGTLLSPGMTLKVGTEQMYVSAVSGNVATVARGVNGTTAASHSSATIYRYAIPAPVEKYCLHRVTEDFKIRDGGAFESERIGDYSYKRATGGNSNEFANRAIGYYRRRLI